MCSPAFSAPDFTASYVFSAADWTAFPVFSTAPPIFSPTFWALSLIFSPAVFAAAPTFWAPTTTALDARCAVVLVGLVVAFVGPFCSEQLPQARENMIAKLAINTFGLAEIT